MSKYPPDSADDKEDYYLHVGKKIPNAGKMKTITLIGERYRKHLSKMKDYTPLSITFSYFVKSKKSWMERTVKIEKNSDLFKLADYFSQVLDTMKIKHSVKDKMTKV